MRVLIAVDFGLCGRAQIEFLRKFDCGGQMCFRIVHVIEPLSWQMHTMQPTVVPICDPLIEQMRSNAEQLVRDVSANLNEIFPDSPIDRMLVEGIVAEEILRCAATWKADLILVGSHGRAGLQRFLLGSVSQAVSTNAECSVLIARRK